MAESRAETVGRVMAHSPAEMQSRREAALKYPPGRRRAAKRAATRGAKDAALAAFAVEKAAHERRIAELERQLAEEREAHIAAIRERDRLQDECGRLQGELHKRGEIANRCF